jgi:hypothetical protein
LKSLKLTVVYKGRPVMKEITKGVTKKEVKDVKEVKAGG